VAVEPTQIEGNIGKFVEEQKDADTDKHDSGKSLNPKQVPTEFLKDRETSAEAEGHENERYSKAQRINSQQRGSLPHGFSRCSHHKHGGQRRPGAWSPAKGEGQPEQKGTQLALPYFALKSHISIQKFEWKQPQENKSKENDACTGDTIQRITLGG